MLRRIALIALALVPAPALAGFGFDDVVERARKVAAEPYEEPARVPDWLRQISYDQWRDIRYRPEDTIWGRENLPFQVQLFHPGLYYDRPVAVSTVDERGVHPVPFTPSRFDYGRNDFASRVPQNLGYAGFRLHAPFKTPQYYDEVIVFLGASYFRAVGRDQVFGLTARALAIDTAQPKGEEFPGFAEIWLVKPGAKDTQATVYGLLDSPSLTGAYRFVIEPGEQTSVQVEARIFLRREVEKLGLAPLTSMFYHGENNTADRALDDFRPEAHDSDGLLVFHGSGEWLWRPLDNPESLSQRTFHVMSLRGFGLQQRDRDFDDYEDLETRYELRPSAWIAPHGDWGAGRVELIEIPAKSDTNDNVVTYWVPDTQPKPGAPLSFAYTLYWYGADATRPPDGFVTATRRDRGNKDDAYRFIVEFGGRRMQSIPGEEVLRADVTVAGEEDVAELLDQQVVKNPVTGAWRLTFQVRPKSGRPVELRAFLDRGGETLTETWSYTLVP